MFQSKFFSVMILATLLVMIAAVVFQVVEMQEYRLFSAMFGAK